MDSSAPSANNLEKQVQNATEENNTATEKIRELLDAHIEKTNIEEYCKTVNDEKLQEDDQTSQLTSDAKLKKPPIDEFMAGGDPTMISLDGIMIIILLLHGQIATTEAPINTSTLNVSNLASISTAPAGMVNIGTNYEIAIHSKFLTKDLKKQIEDLVEQNIKGNLQKIEDKAYSAISAFSLVCDFCINLPNTIFGYLQSCVSSTASTIIGYTPKGILKICKSLTSTLTGGAQKRRAPPPNPIAKRALTNSKMCSVSPDVCVSLLNSLRTSLKKFDADRFSSEICPPQIVSASPHLQDPYCSSAIANANDRYRHVHILKGFSADPTVQRVPLINKYLSFSTSNDAALNMGVTTLRFNIGTNNKVTCIPKTMPASSLMSMPNIKYAEIPDTRDTTGRGIIYFSTTQRLIEYCITHADTPPKTAIIIDLSCSSCPLPVLIPLDPYNTVPGTVFPGGNKRYINKRNKKFKVKTKKRKVKSLSKKNRRNVKKVKRKTKKVRRTYRK
jgi:hypothetical protein